MKRTGHYQSSIKENITLDFTQSKSHTNRDTETEKTA